MIREFQKESTEAQKENTAAVRELTTEIKTMAVKNSLQEDRIKIVEALAHKNKERHDLNQSKLKIMGIIGTSGLLAASGALWKLITGG